MLPYRERALSAAEGVVVEVGVGSGLNLPLYEGKRDVYHVYGVDPSPELRAMAFERVCGGSPPIDLLEASAEQLPFADASVDAIVMTRTLCTIPDPIKALAEMGRVLRKSGRLLFVEHGLSPERRVERRQRWLTPIWAKIGGRCHLDRKTDDLIRAAGFQINGLHADYMKGPKPMTYMYERQARPA